MPTSDEIDLIGRGRPASPPAPERAAEFRVPVIGGLTLVTLIAAFTPIAARWASADIAPVTLGFIRFALATLLLGATMLARRQRLDFGREDWPRVILLGLLCVPINQPLYILGTHLASAGHSGLIYALTPVLVLLFVRLKRSELITWRKLIGIALSFSGVAFIIITSGISFSPEFVLGDCLLLGAVISWSMYVVASKTLVERHGALKTQTGAFLTGTIIYLPILLIDGSRTDWGAVSTTAWMGYLYLSVVTSFVGYFLWNWALSRADASRVSVINNLAPIVTLALGALILGESITPALVIGGIATLAGAIITQRG